MSLLLYVFDMYFFDNFEETTRITWVFDRL